MAQAITFRAFGADTLNSFREASSLADQECRDVVTRRDLLFTERRGTQINQLQVVTLILGFTDKRGIAAGMQSYDLVSSADAEPKLYRRISSPHARHIFRTARIVLNRYKLDPKPGPLQRNLLAGFQLELTIQADNLRRARGICAKRTPAPAQHRAAYA